jgi:hypothetical protein
MPESTIWNIIKAAKEIKESEFASVLCGLQIRTNNRDVNNERNEKYFNYMKGFRKKRIALGRLVIVKYV